MNQQSDYFDYKTFEYGEYLRQLEAETCQKLTKEQINNLLIISQNIINIIRINQSEIVTR